MSARIEFQETRRRCRVSARDGGPAFPQQLSDGQRAEGSTMDFWCCGMTPRDWFAGQALTAIAHPGGYDNRFEEAASESYRYADAMLAEREKSKP